jgi:hypothetical protein
VALLRVLVLRRRRAAVNGLLLLRLVRLWLVRLLLGFTRSEHLEFPRFPQNPDTRPALANQRTRVKVFV